MDLDQFVGRKYKLATADAKNFDEYLKFLEIGLVSRKTAGSVNPVVELTKDENGYYVLTFHTLIKTVRSVFKIGEEFLEERPDGVKVKSKMTVEDGKLVHIQVEDNGRTSKHVRTFTDESITAVTTAEGWDGECVRVYKYAS
ncbi:fatty acid-binding protein-like [Plodia interpunctella]|uniref:fatty acid-binding protein-like n=1 Tax=Plodia interpunctella TaxID=58824 RepID=UPI0023681340|nr:fatty acid-binding protein, muscle-like [Plodia interpunctella]